MLKDSFTNKAPGKGAPSGAVTFPFVMVLQPGNAKTIGLGAYDASMPQPEFVTTFEPAGMEDMVSASIDRLDIPGKQRYLLLYLVHNFGNKPCRVVIRPRNERAQ